MYNVLKFDIKNASKYCHSGRYGHKNETQILEIVAFIMQFYTYFKTYDMNQAPKNALSLLIWSFISSIFRLIDESVKIYKVK